MTDVASLTLKVDATSVDAGKRSVKEFNEAAAATPAALNPARSATAEMAAQIRAMEQAYIEEAKAAKASATETLRAAQAASQGSGAAQGLAGATRQSASEALRAAQAGATHSATTATVTAAQEALTNAVRQGLPVSAEMIRAAGGMANAMKIMEAAHKTGAAAAGAHTAAVHGLSGGMGKLQISTSTAIREVLVLAREAGRGDFTRMAGSASILAQALGGLQLIMTPVGAGIAALLAVVAGGAAIMFAGQKEWSDLTNAMVITGNYAGMTADKFEHAAERISESNKVGIMKTKEVLLQLTASGKFQGETLELAAENATMFARYTGQSAADIAKSYDIMKGGVVKWAVRHNEVYHDLTLAQVDRIAQLEREGKHQEAVNALMGDINKEIKERALPAYGWLQIALKETGRWADDMWNRLLGLGRPETLEVQLAKAKQNLDMMREGEARTQSYWQKGIGAPGFSDTHGGIPGQQRALGARIGAAQGRYDALRLQKEEQDRKAKEDAEKAEKEDDAIRAKYDNRAPKIRTSGSVNKVAEQQEDLKAAIQGNRDMAVAYDLSSAAGFRAAAAAKAAADAATANGKAEEFLELRITEAVTASMAAGAKQVDTLSQKTTAQKAVNEMMKTQNISQQEANRLVSDSIAVAQLQAAADNATGEDKERLLKIINDLKQGQIEYNAAVVDGKITEATRDQKAENEELQIRLDLTNKTNREQADALAILRAKKELEKMGEKDMDSERARKYIADARLGAKLNQDLADGVGNVIKQQEEYVANLEKMADLTIRAAKNMGDAFGGMGKNIADLVEVLENYSVAEAKSALTRDKAIEAANGDREKIKKIEKEYRITSVQDNAQYYGDIAAAAKGFFDEQSEMYKLLTFAEQAYRAVEFAGSAQSIVQKGIEVAEKVGLYAIETGAALISGAANFFAQSGWGGFAGVAAMIAVMAGLGYMGTIGSTGPSMTVDAEDTQAAQGSGSVFGDSEAKSNSISRSLEIMTDNSNTMLEYTNDMRVSLDAIQSAMGALTNMVVRNLTGVDGKFSSAYGKDSAIDADRFMQPNMMKQIFAPGGIDPLGLFDTKITTKYDQGMRFGSQNLQDIIDKGIDAELYRIQQTKTESKAFGVTYSTKIKNKTTTSDLDEDVANQVTLIVKSLRDGVVTAAGIIGLESAEEMLKKFQVNLGSISFKDMKADEIEAAIEAVFSKLGDDMAKAAMPGIVEFMKVGEGAFETLTRLARDYQVVDVTLSSIGKTFGAVGLSSVKAREHLIDLFGSLDEFTDYTQQFADDFLSDAERMAPVQAAVTAEMNRLGLANITTKEQFKQLVLGLNVSTEAGAELYAALMKVGPAFAAVKDFAEEAAETLLATAQDRLAAAQDAVAKGRDDLIAAYQNESKALQDVIGRFREFTADLREYQNNLNTGDVASLSPQDQLAAARDLFNSTAAAALTGDETAIANLTTVSDAFLEASRGFNASNGAYFDDLQSVKDAIEATIGYTQGRVDAAQAQQDALDTMVNAFAEANNLLFSVNDNIVDMNDEIGTVADAMAAMVEQLAEYTAALAALQILLPPVVAPPAPVVVNVAANDTAAPTPAQTNATQVNEQLVDLLGQAVELIGAGNNQQAAMHNESQDAINALSEQMAALKRAMRTTGQAA